MPSVEPGMDTSDAPNTETPTTIEFDEIPSSVDEYLPEPIVEPQSEPSDPLVARFVYDEPTPDPEEELRPEPVSASINNEPPRNRPSTALFFASSLVAGILGAVLTVGVLAVTGTFDDPEPAPTPSVEPNAEQAGVVIETPPTQIINDLGSAVNPAAVAAKAVPSIVTVAVYETPADEDATPVGVGSGSGVVMSTTGYIITNHHVVAGADTYTVTFEDGRIYTAELVGSDALTDLAVLQIEAEGLVPVEFGATEPLNVGDPAVAIGNPLGQEGGSSVSVGIISAFDRQVTFLDDSALHGMIQTDAAINSGSSGGALFDSEANLIGITSAIGVSQAGPEGIGYAIPIELVDRITAEIIETGDVIHPFLGVTIGTYIEEASDGALVPAGALIHTIEGSESAASIAGLAEGDVVTSIGGKAIIDQTGLILAVRLYRVGDEVEFVAQRDGETMTFSVTMGERPPEHRG